MKRETTIECLKDPKEYYLCQQLQAENKKLKLENRQLVVTNTNIRLSDAAAWVDLQAELADYKECAEDKKRLCWEIDVIISGKDGAAKQASLCDLVGPIKHLQAENDKFKSYLGPRQTQQALKGE